MSKEYPAKTAALKSREYVHGHNKAGWLGLFAEDAVIEDPIGPSYLDPAGKGHGTVAAREAFWNNNIGPARIGITIHQSYGAANECANHVTLDLQNEVEGKKNHVRIFGVFTYKVNDAGKITSLRGYWEPENVEVVV
ncbi:MAG: nuclear transport factor 2 family protein [Proteobacteria bacterium]|nr:nuclear transport factor 2 family protein [Pseudomonadota bacterium]HQR03568.1 nuclear transport factor 2 family protein [Rhodocyclaceae bacterium]